MTKPQSNPPLSQRRTPIPDAYTHPDQDPSTYLSTQQLADRIMSSPEQVHRWCRKDWFGTLPPGRRGRGMGYRIPPLYVRVARCWNLMQGGDMASMQVKKAARKALLDDPEAEAKNWVVVVASTASCHYTHLEATNRVEQLGGLAEERKAIIHVIPVGDPPARKRR